MGRDSKQHLESNATSLEQKSGLLIGFRTDHLGALAQQAPSELSNLRVAHNFEDIKRIFAQETIDYVVYGCEHDTDRRLRLLEQILRVSPLCEAYLLGQDSDPILFVNSLLRQQKSQQEHSAER